MSKLKKWQETIIKALRDKIPYASHPKAKYWNAKIEQIENGNLIKLPKDIIKKAVDYSPSKVTENKVKDYNTVKTHKLDERGRNKLNLRIETQSSNGTTGTYEIYLDSGKKHNFNDLYKQANEWMNYKNSHKNMSGRSRKGSDFEGNLINIKNMYMVERNTTGYKKDGTPIII